MTERLDIFKTLDNIDSGNLSYLSELDPQFSKQFSPLVVMRWASGTSSKAQILKLNAFVNPFVFSLGSNKSLLYNLLLAASDGKQKSYKWVKRPSKGGNKPQSIEVIKRYYSCSSTRAAEYVKLLNVSDVVDIASSLGEDTAVIKAIQKEFK